MAASNRWRDICDHLKSKGFDVYAPAQHKGECTTRYVVIKALQALRVSSFSSISQVYDVMLYVPQAEYSRLEEFVGELESAMTELEPMVMPMHYRTPSFYDESVKGHMVSIQYRNSRKI